MPLDTTGADDWVAAQKPTGADDWVSPPDTKKSKKPEIDEDLPWDTAESGAQLRARKKADETAEAVLPTLKPDETISPLQLIGRIFARTFLQPAVKGGQSALGERPLPTGTEGLQEAALGATPFRAGIPAEAAGVRPRVEPAPPPTVGPDDWVTPKGATLDEAGITPTPESPPREPRPGASLAEAGITPERPPEPAEETQTVAQPQADGTVTQVQVKTGEPPPPPTPPATPVENAAEIGPEFRGLFPNLTDSQFEALFTEAAQKVPGGIPLSPAATRSWLKRVGDVMRRMGTPAAAPAAKKTEPELTPESLAADREIFAQATPQEPTQPEQEAPAEPPKSEEPAQAATEKASETQEVQAHGGPWKPVLKDGEPAKNHLGDTVYENPNGVRAIMDGGIPWMERVKKSDQGMVPADPENRKSHHLTEDERARPQPIETKPAEMPQEEPTEETKRPDTKPPAPETSASATKSKSQKSEWTLLGTNAEGVPVYKNQYGVHSTVKDGIRSTETVRMRPTKSGMEVSVPAPEDKDPEFQVATDKSDVSSSPKSTPVEKPRFEYNKYATGPGEKAANKLAVDALNGDIPEKEAIAGLGKLVRDGTIQEGVARINLSRLTDWNEGEWDAAKAPPKSSEPTEAEKPKPAETGGPEEKPTDLAVDDRETVTETPSAQGGGNRKWDASRRQAWETRLRKSGTPGGTSDRRGGTFVVDGRGIGGEGTYFWRDGKLHRSFRFTVKSPAWYREATPEEEEEVRDAIEAGAFQITTHGPEGLAQKWSHDMPVQVNHQATGRPLPGTDAEKRLVTAMSERQIGQETASSPPTEPGKTVIHVTAKGKTLTGTVRRDLSYAAAKTLDPYTFKKEGGYFIRAKEPQKVTNDTDQATETEEPSKQQTPERTEFGIEDMPKLNGANAHDVDYRKFEDAARKENSPVYVRNVGGFWGRVDAPPKPPIDYAEFRPNERPAYVKQQDLGHWLNDMPEAERQRVYAGMRAIDKQMDRYYNAPSQGGQGIAVGAQAFDDIMAAEVRREFLKALRAGQTPEEAANTVKELNHKFVRKHNERRPTDINWKRSLTNYDRIADLMVTTFRHLPNKP